MRATTIGATTNAFEEIVDWSADRPAWQQDALRRLLAKPTLQDADVQELVALCLAPHGFATDLTAEPLTRRSARHPHAGDRRIQLTGIRDVRGVDALEPGQHLAFGTSGLTVVFGRNRSGKSSYARILKQACRARAREQLRGNVFAGGNEERQATVEYQIEGEREEWRLSEPDRAELHHAAVYDASCGAVLRRSDTEVLYLPLGLDLFQRLADTCDRVRGLIESRAGALAGHRRVSSTITEGTEARAVAERISSTATDSDIENATRFTEEDERRLAELTVVLARHETASVRQTEELLLRRLESLRTRLEKVDRLLGIDAVAKLRELHAQSVTAREAASVASQDAFLDGTLAGVGDTVWRGLWDAARRYSTEAAYPNQTYPVVGDGAVCVLCEQPLGNDAGRRLLQLEEFVQQEAQANADAYDARLETALMRLADVPLAEPGDDTLWDEVAGLDAGVGRACPAYLNRQLARRDQIAAAGRSLAWPEVENPPGPLHTSVDDLVSRVRVRIEEMKAAEREEERVILQKELRELSARRELAGKRAELVADVSRLRDIAALKRALADTTTNAITRKSTELTKRYVTDALLERFETEAERLGLRQVVLRAAGRKGVLHHRIELDSTAEAATPDEILSDGELSALGLAAFLAETDESVSSIVLDDPVTSFDEDNRQRIARHLASLCRERQVIVFTHDAVFALWLCEAANDYGVELTGQRVVRAPGPGVTRNELPWTASPLKQRFGDLQQTIARARKLQGNGAPEAEGIVRDFYKRLRTTWERALEETLLGRFFTRFATEIHVTPLLRLPGFTDDDARQFDEGYSKASALGEMHDESPAVNRALPSPEEMSEDLAKLRDWNDRMKKMMNPRGGQSKGA